MVRLFVTNKITYFRYKYDRVHSFSRSYGGHNRSQQKTATDISNKLFNKHLLDSQLDIDYDGYLNLLSSKNNQNDKNK
jgi:hypothetical protein